jgi:hypothetical protein
MYKLNIWWPQHNRWLFYKMLFVQRALTILHLDYSIL